jgi:DUF438 domain-containing protein
MESKAKTVMEGKLDSSREMFRSAGNIKKKKKNKKKSLVKAIKKILENGKKTVS